MAADARTGLSGIVEGGGAGRIIDEISGDSNIFKGSDLIEAPQQQQQQQPSGYTEQASSQRGLPAFPEEEVSHYTPTESRRKTFETENIPGRNLTVEGNQQERVAKQANDELKRKNEEAKRSQEEQTGQQVQAPRSMRELRGAREDRPYSTQRIDVPSYSGMQPFTESVDLVSRGEERVPIERTNDVISNFLQDAQFTPRNTGSEELSEQADENNVRKTDEVIDRDVEKAASESQATQVAETIDSAKSTAKENSVDSVSIEYEPQFDKFDYHDMPTVQFSKTQSAIKDSTASAVAEKSWDGNAFTEKAIASDKVAPCDVSIGSLVIMEIVREPNNNLIAIVNATTGSTFTVEQVLTYDGMLMFADAVNSANIDIVSTKSPVVGPSDAVARRMRIHDGRGIKVHRTQTKLWNLDFDGDGISISFDMHDGAKNAVNFLVNINGQAMIDTDFFLVSRISGDKDEYVEAFKTFFLEDISDYNGIDLTPLAEAMYYVSNPQLGEGVDEKKYMNSVWVNALNEMRALSRKFSNPDIAMSGILKDIYDRMLLLHQFDVADIALRFDDEQFDSFNEIDSQEEPADEYIRQIVGQMAAGNLPPNFQDFITGLHQYIGEVPDKNVGFRIGAKYAKFIKASQLTFKGDEESYKLIYKLTLQAGEAMFMSGRATIGERVAYMQRIAKNKVQAEVGFPRNYKTVGEFLRKFRQSYNQQMRMIECSDFGGFSCEMDPNPDPDRRTYYVKSDKLSDLVTPLISVYGDYTIDYLFPNIEFVDFIDDGKHSTWEDRQLMLLEGYRKMTLKELSNNNRLDIPSTAYVTRVIEDKNGNKSRKKTEVKFYDMKMDDAMPSHLLFAVAGKRTAAASKYHKDTLTPLLKNFVKCIQMAKNSYANRMDNLADYRVSMSEMMAALHLSGKAMFDYFGMTDPLSFFQSQWGRLLNLAVDQSYFGAKDHGFGKVVKRPTAEDAVGGVRASMVYEFKMRRVDAINDEINRILNSADVSEIADCMDGSVYTVSTLPRRLNMLQNRLEAEFDALASISDLWKVIVGEIRDGNNSAFQQLKLSQGTLEGFLIDCNDGCKFWSSSAVDDYNSLYEVMQDPKLPKSVKEQIAVDVVRVATGFNKYKAYEMNYQLELESDATYTSLNLMAYNEQPSVISEIHEANNALRKFFKKNWDSVVTDVKKARQRAESEPGRLNSYINNLADNPELYLEVPSEFVADAIEAQMDKTSRAGEKAHQEIQVDGFFNALMLQRGGLTDAVYRTEARSINMIAEDMLSAYDIIRLLANPDLEILVYNGEIRYPLSRKVLCGDNSETALWDMLEQNPRIACLLRCGTISSGNKGQSIYKNARASFYDSMFEVSQTRIEMFKGKVKSELIDKPMFLSLVAMFVPEHNRSSRSLRTDHADMFEALQSFVVYHANATNSGKVIDINSILENELGVTIESLTARGMRPEAARRWHEAMAYFVVEYIDTVAQYMREENFSEKQVNAILESYRGQDAVFDFDLQSIALAVDCRQTFTGAKTETSTGVEGNITRNHLGTGLYASAVHGRHEIIDGGMSPGDLAPFVGCLTNFGVFDGTNIDELEELSGDEPLIVEAHEGYQKQDETLYEDGYQVTTLGRFISVKRGKAAEEGNLKVKRSGDDGTDSVTKFNRYDEKSADNVGYIERAYNDAEIIPGQNNKLFAAKLALANILQRVDNAEGYDDMDLSDYMDLAEIMINEVQDDTGQGAGIVIRSLGEISSAIKRQMDQDTVENGTPRDIINAAMQIADQVGMSGPLVNDEAHEAALLAASKIQSDPGIRKFKSMAKPSEGTFERNYNTFGRITTRRSLKVPWSGKTISTDEFFADGKSPERIYPFSQDKLESKGYYKDKNGKIHGIFVDGIDGWTKPKGFGEQPKFGKKKLFFYCPINVTRKSGSKKKSITTNISPGPQSVWVLESGASKAEIKKAIETCYTFGMTLAFTDSDALGDYREAFAPDITEAPFGNGYMMIPFFNIIQSGGAINPPMSPGSFDINPNNYSVIVEDGDNYYGLSDADMLTDSRTAKEINCTASGVERIKIGDLFYNVMHDETVDPVTGKRVCDMVTDVRLARWDEIRRDIVDYVDDGPSFDLGIAVTNPHSDDALKKFGLQVQEYRDAFGSANANGIVKSSRPDRIIGWMRCVVGNGHDSAPIYAPIIPFPTGTSMSVPTRFDIFGCTIQDGNPRNTVDMCWRVSESIEGQIVKVHDGSNAAGKSVSILVSGQELGNFRNGRKVDHIIAAVSNKSRKLGTDPRHGTMQTLARIAKLDYGFNFADVPNSFPDNPSIKESLRTRYIPMEQWEAIDKQVSRYSTDPEVDAFVRNLVRTALDTGTTNPTDLIACKFDNGSGVPVRTFRYVDYEFFFDPSDKFENAMLNFYNSMIPELCPPSIDSYGDGKAVNGKDYLFKPVDDVSKEFQYGCLQMLTPFPGPDGNGKIWRWNNCFLNLNFYNDEYTGLHKPGMNGSHATMEQISAMAISGYPLAGRDMKLFSEYTMSPAYKYYGGYEIHLDRGKFLGKER